MKVDITIEVPKGSRNKYEFDKEKNVVRLDRVLRSSVVYPGDYGFLPESICDDGDPLDVLVVNRFPTFSGCIVSVRPIAMLEMIDTGENDEKIIAVPADDVYFDSWTDLGDIPEPIKEEIHEFFNSYKNLEKNKTVELKDWKDAKAAEEMIEKSLKDYAEGK